MRCRSYSLGMRTAVKTLGVVVALLAPSTGVAFGHMIGHRPAPRIVVSYKGSDAAGRVTFKLHGRRITPLGSLIPIDITNFHFANRCSATGTTVAAAIAVGPKHGFGYHASGISIRGSFSGSRYANASGTARIRTGTCDSGPLTFSATKT